MWSVDGNIEYGSGKHLVLVLISCGVLVVGLAYPEVLFTSVSHSTGGILWQDKPLLDAYGGPYSDSNGATDSWRH